MEAQKTSPSPYLVANSGRAQTEAEYRQALAARLRAEGDSEAIVKRLTVDPDDATIRRMIENERRTLAAVTELFMGGRGL